MTSSHNLAITQSQPTLQADNPLFLYFSALSRYDVGNVIDNDQSALMHKEYVKNAGWVKFLESDKNDQDYRGVAFINHSSKEIVIAHRGTNIDTNQASEANIIADYLIATKELPFLIICEALVFAESTRLLAEKKNLHHYIVHQTGFSLGGYLAGIAGGLYEKKYPETNGLTITIDAPGTLHATKILITEDDLIADNIHNTIDYVIVPSNLVNLCNERAAKEIRKLKSTNYRNELSEIDEFNLGENLSLYETVTILAHLRSHDLNNLIQFVSRSNNKLSYESVTEYDIRTFTPQYNARPLQLNGLLAHVAIDGAFKGGALTFSALGNASTKTQLGVCLGLLLAGTASYYYSDKILDQIETTTQNSLAPSLVRYQKVLDNLHVRFRVSGMTAGTIKTIKLQALEQRALTPTIDEAEFQRLYKRSLELSTHNETEKAIKYLNYILAYANFDLNNRLKGKAYLARGCARNVIAKTSHEDSLILIDFHMACKFDYGKLPQIIIDHRPFQLSAKDIANPLKLISELEKRKFSLSAHLYNCAKEGELLTLMYLHIKLKISVNKKFAQGYTPLLIAAENGQFTVVKWLLEKTNVEYAAKTESGKSAYELAKAFGHYDLALYIKDFMRTKLINNAPAIRTVTHSHALINQTLPVFTQSVPMTAVKPKESIKSPPEVKLVPTQSFLKNNNNTHSAPVKQNVSPIKRPG